MNWAKYARGLALGLLCAFMSSTAFATSFSFTTVFGEIPGPTPSGAGPGQLAPDVGLFPSPSVLNGLENFTNFNVQNLNQDLSGGGANQGQVVFFQNGDFYVGGLGPASANPLSSQGSTNLGGAQVNNRAYGVFGAGRSDFTFDPAAMVDSVIIQHRGTANGDSIGSDAALGQSLPENAPLADADGTLLVYTNAGLQITQSLSNASFETTTVDVSSIPGDFITRVSLVNEATALNSAVVIGELTASAANVDVNGNIVPEPTSLVLISMAAGLAMVRRRVG